jgi:tRNA-specific 2-thiouridylase
MEEGSWIDSWTYFWYNSRAVKDSIKNVKDSTKNKTVVVGLSGGVDSSVSAYLLKKQGYRVIGAFMKNWAPEPRSPFASACSWKDDWRSAVRTSAKLNIPFVTFDFRQEYEDRVIKYFFEEYAKGRTPNPDVVCKTQVKFDLFLKEATKLKADFIATGHYVQKSFDESAKQYKLLRGKDPEKDQSYFLNGLDQDQIKSALFPVGDIAKKQVRHIAETAKLPAAFRQDSQGICFIGEVDVAKFIESRIPARSGDIIFQDKIVGRHQGIQFFTIGQRKGLNDPDMQAKISKYFKKDVPPVYVIDINADKNQVIIGLDSELYRESMVVEKLHWISGIVPKEQELEVQIRYQHVPVSCKIKIIRSRCEALFVKPVRAVTPGQYAVFYQGEEMLGGGIIVG